MTDKEAEKKRKQLLAALEGECDTKEETDKTIDLCDSYPGCKDCPFTTWCNNDKRGIRPLWKQEG